MRHVSVSGRRTCSVRVGIVISALVYLAIGPDARDRVTHREYFGLMPSLAAQAPTPSYTYTVIADVSNCFKIGAPVLNNEGEAAFAGQCSSGAIVVRRGDGGAGPLAEIYTGPTSSGFSLSSLSFPSTTTERSHSMAGPDRRVADSVPRFWSAMAGR